MRSCAGSAFLVVCFAATLLCADATRATDPADAASIGPEISSLEASLPTRLLLVGQSTRLSVTGKFVDGTTRDVTTDVDMIYNPLPAGIVTIEADGTVRAEAPADVVIYMGYHHYTSIAFTEIAVSVRADGDADADGLPDAYELQHGLDPQFPGDALVDVDGDAMDNLEEFENGTDPRRADTDGDLEPDGIELEAGTDPLVPDQPVEEPPILDNDCIVSALNRTAPVDADGVWVLPNVPAGTGQLRVRATCVEDGVLRSGQSDLLSVPSDGIIEVTEIRFDDPQPIPAALALSAPNDVLSSIGETLQLTTTATLVDGSLVDVTAAEDGTDYRVSNAAVATVDADGLITAVASGVVLVSATNEGALALHTLQVVLSGDSDGDGLPDDYEIANGLDPNNPVDALLDSDEDGLTRADEFGIGTDPTNPDTDGDTLLDGEEGGLDPVGTDPLLFDTDVDGFSDGLEIELGTDPLDPASFDLAAALTALEVRPSTLVLVVDALTLDESRRLSVTGTLIDGTEIDLTSRARGTQYNSSDLTVCNFGAEDGRIFAGQDGNCTVTVTNNGFAATVDVVVESFAPTARSALSLPGYANNVDVDGDWAFVAAGAAGLVVIDVADRNAPVIAATLDTPGNANDVRVEDGRAYIADGVAGLRIVDVTNPRSPVGLAALDTPGDARDVALDSGLVLVADGPGGLRLIDVADPSAPALAGSLAIPGEANGVDVDGARRIAAVAARAGGFHVVDVSEPENPTLAGSVATEEARDVDVVGTTAWLADFTGGLKSIDLSDPASPRLTATVAREQAGIPNDVVVKPPTATAPAFAFVAEAFFAPTAVPIVAASDPGNPLTRAVLSLGDEVVYDGRGLAIDDNFVYLAATRSSLENGTTGDSVLFIGQSLGFRDGAGVAPSIRLLSPLSGTEVAAGAPILVEAEADDDVGVFAVRFVIDGTIVFDDRDAPFATTIPAPDAPATLSLGAFALDFNGNRADAEPVAVRVTAPSTTSVIGAVADAVGTAIEGASVITNLGGSDTTDDGGFFRVDEVPADEGDVVVFATAERDGATLRGQSAPTAPVAGGFTDVGEIRLGQPRDLFPGRKFPIFEPSPISLPDSSPQTLARGDFNGDGVTDWAGSGLDLDGIGIFLGRGDGTFEPVRIVPAARSIGIEIAAVDLDGDGLDDLVALHGQSDQVLSFRSLGDGTFATADTVAVGDQPWRVAVGDLDHDGVADLAVLNLSGGDLSLLLGRGDGTFAPETRLVTGPANDLLLADLDADGNGDLVVVNRGTTRVSIYDGRGDGGFEPARTLDVGVRGERVLYVDVDADGLKDLAVHGDSLSIRLGRGDGTFAAPVFSAGARDRFFEFAIHDLDLDGWPDLALISKDSDSDRIDVRLGDGSGRFSVVGTVRNHVGIAETFRLDDVDLDGFPDLLVGGHGGLKVFRGSGSPSFARFLRHPVAASSAFRLVAAGDVNVDGVTDLVQHGFEILLHLGRTEGGFDDARAIPSAPGGNGLWVAELTRDGLPDVVSRSHDMIEVLPGRGDGTFAPARRTPLPLSFSLFEDGAVLGDFDGDGLSDVAAARGDLSGTDFREVVLMLNRGDGTFVLAEQAAVGQLPRDLEAADLDGDGRLDLAVTNFLSEDVSVLLNRGGTLVTATTHAVGFRPESVVALDADGDGRTDLVVEDDFFRGRLRILRGHGDGTFAEGGFVESPRLPRHLVAADVDRDGFEDLVLANTADDVAIYLGRGDGTFAPGLFYASGAMTTDSATPGLAVLVPADLDGDGRLDFVVRGGRTLHFLIQEE